VQFSVGLLSGDEPPEISLLESIKAADQSVFLFIAGGKKHEEVDFNTVFADAVTDRGTLWVVSDVGHTGAFGAHRDEYEQRMIAFFEDNLLSP
jgi:hypothetical protein